MLSLFARTLCLALCGTLFVVLPSLRADILTWDGDTATAGLQDGIGTWDTTTSNRWFNTVSASYQLWNSATPDDAIFGNASGTAGTITLGSGITVGNLTFNAATTGTYNINSTTNALTLGGATVPTITTNVDAIISASIAGANGMTKLGTGNLTLSGATTANTLTGTTNVSAGTLTISKTAGVNAIAGDILVNGGTLTWGANNQVADTSNLTISSGTVSFTGKTETLASFTKTGGDIASLNGGTNGSITITGIMAISGGTSNGGSAFGYTINSGGTTTAGTLDFTGFSGVALQMGGNSTAVITTMSVGSGGLILSGQTLQLNAATTASAKGDQLILGGDVKATGVNIIAMDTGTSVSGAVNQINLGAATRTLNVVNSGDTLNINASSGTSTKAITIIGAGGLTKTGAGTLQFNGTAANTYNGLTTVSAGTLILNKSAAVNAIAGDISVTGGTLQWNQSDQIADTSSITVAGGNVNFNAKNETLLNLTQTSGNADPSGANSGQVTITGTLAVSGGSTFTINSGGRFTANKVDFTGYSGTALVIGGNSASVISNLTIGSGGLILNGQTLQLNAASVAGNLGSQIILNGDVTASGTNVFQISGAPVSGSVNQINMGTGTRTWNISAGTTTVNSAIPLVGGADLTKTGAGILQVNGPATYTGKTTVSQGTFKLGAATASINSTPWIQIDAGATLDTSGLGAGGYNYTPASGNGVISGTGTVSSALTVGQGAVVKPGTTSNPADSSTAGDGVGTLNTGNLTFAPTSASNVSQLKILSSSSADKINITGTLTLNANSNIMVTFDPGYTPTSGDSWTLLDWSSTLALGGFSTGTNFRTGHDADANEGNLDLPDISASGLNWSISSMINGGALVVTVVPEPGRFMLLAVGLVAVCWRRRR